MHSANLGRKGWSMSGKLDIHLTPLPDFCRIVAFWDVSLGGGSALAMDHGGVGGGSRGYRLLNEAEEQHPSAFRSPPIKPERELVQVVGKVLVADGALVGTDQPSFQQRHDQMHPRQQLPGVLALPAQHRHLVIVSQLVQPLVTCPTVRMHPAAPTAGQRTK